MMMDAEKWMQVKYSGDVTSDGLKHAMIIQTQAALKMEQAAGNMDGRVAKKVARARRQSRRLSVSGGKSIDEAIAATAEANNDTKNRVSSLRENAMDTIMDDEEDARRLQAKRGGHRGKQRSRRRAAPKVSLKSTTHENAETLSSSNSSRPKTAGSPHTQQMEKNIAMSVRRLLLMSQPSILQLQSRATTGTGFASSSVHSLLATLLLETKLLTAQDIKSQSYIQSVDAICGEIDTHVLLSPARPTLRTLRSRQRSPSAKSMCLSMLSPSKQTSNVAFDPSANAATERLYCGRGGGGGNKLERVVEKAMLSRSLSNNTHDSKKKDYMRVTRIKKSMLGTRNGMQRRWKNERWRPRKEHFRKNRRDHAKEAEEYEHTKPHIVVEVEDGRYGVLKDPVLLSKIGSIVVG